jgi:LacI family transcriptional regulator
MMTVGLLFAVKEMKLRLPGDISVVGIDDLEFAKLLEPQPTTVQTPILKMAKQSIELLLQQIAARTAPTGKRDIHQPKLIVRESTAPLATIAAAPKTKSR